MLEELAMRLFSYARENDLRFEAGYAEEEKVYYFRFQNQERTWGYRRLFTKEQLDSFAGDSTYFAKKVIHEFEKKVPFERR